MATTRAKTGNSKPRKVLEEVKESIVKPKVAKKRSTSAIKKATGSKAGTSKTAGTKANTSKPRAKKTATGRVTKSASTKKSAANTTSTTKKAAPLKKTAKKDASVEKPSVTEKHEPAEKTDKAEKVGSRLAEPNHEPTLLEKVEGVALKVQGFITGQSGKKAAGTAKLRGTSGKKTGTGKATKAAA